jgi:aryl-alcohol dehydrogenase-like predicted oxidoreductase
MQERNVGKSGLRVSAIGLGCNNFGRPVDLEGSRAVIHKALDLGVTLFDCGDVYGRRGGAEKILGEVLGPRRKDIVLVTKFGRPMDSEGRLKGGSRRYIMSAVEASLQRLKTDWIDLYQYHLVDPLTPVEETLRALDDLVRQGKVRYIGCSHMPAWQVVHAVWTSRSNNITSFIACEDEYSLLGRGIERELLPAMEQMGLGLLPYYPLASGLLTGKYKRGEPLPLDSRFAVITERDYVGQFMSEANLTRLDQLTALAERRGYKLLDIAITWLYAKPLVASVIAGATKPEQVEANVKGATLKLTAEDMAELGKITAGSDSAQS